MYECTTEAAIGVDRERTPDREEGWGEAPPEEKGGEDVLMKFPFAKKRKNEEKQ
ncbi:hypothetical protein ES702_03802 [subsurface metagenome]